MLEVRAQELAEWVQAKPKKCSKSAEKLWGCLFCMLQLKQLRAINRRCKLVCFR